MLLYLLIGALTLFYIYVKKKFTYFEKLGIPHQPGTFPFGSDCSWKMVMGKVHFINMQEDCYKQFPGEKLVGYYGIFGSANFVVNDFDLAKKILIKDFEHFTDRRTFDLDKKTNVYLDKMLTNLKGDEWREVRQLMSPIFTSQKLKGMMPTIYDASDDFLKYLERREGKENIEMKDLMQLCTCEILASVGCGVKPKILDNPETSVFYDQLKILLGQKKKGLQFAKILLVFTLPKVMKILKIPFIDLQTQEFFANIIKNSIKVRKESKVKMNDFIDHLIEMGNGLEKHREEFESEFEKDAALSEKELTKMDDQRLEDIIIATGMLVFFAGNDTTSSVMSVVFYFLAQQQDLQEKLYQEIKDAIDENGGSQHLDYNKLHDLKFMEKFIKESIRKWGISFLERVCSKDYYIEELKVTIPKGTLVQIPGASLMNDEKHYQDPEIFDPEAHFNTETLIPSNFYGFGQGPRNCVGMRFAWTVMRALLVRVLANYKILPTGPDFPKEFVIDPKNVAGLSKNGVHVKLEQRT